MHTLEDVEFELLLDDHLECEADHNECGALFGMGGCTRDVVAAVTFSCCPVIGHVLSCQRAVEFIVSLGSEPCGNCTTPINRCWAVRPV